MFKGRWGDNKMYSQPKIESQHVEKDKYAVCLNYMKGGGPGADYVTRHIIILEPTLDATGQAWDFFINGKQDIYTKENIKWDWTKTHKEGK